MHRTTPLAAAILRARGLRTRREFADELGVTENTLYNWETSRTQPTSVCHFVALVRAGVPREVFWQQWAPDLARRFFPTRKDNGDSLLTATSTATLLIEQWMPVAQLIAI